MTPAPRRPKSESDAGPAGADETGDGSGPTLVAHRGCAAEYPENTVSAIESVAPRVDAVEVDIRRCASGELVAFHDETLGRLTDASGRVTETPLERLEGMEVLDSGESIPTLRDVFAAVPGDVDIVLELKDHGLAADAVSIASEFDHDYLVSAADLDVLREVSDADGEVPLAVIARERLLNRALRPFVPGLPSWLYAPEDVAGIVESAVALDCEAIHPRYELCLRTDLVDRAHAADLRVFPWTITDREEFEALRAVGVDGIISDVSAELVD